MKKVLLLSGILLALTASVTLAAGVNLTWSSGTNGCWTEKLTSLTTWTCDNEFDGPWMFVGSFKMDANKTDFAGISAIVDGQSSSPSLPDWWQFFNAGSCRSNSLIASAAFNVGFLKTLCKDPFAGAANGGIGAWQTALYPPPTPLNAPAPNRLRLKVAYVLTASKSLPASQEWYAFWAQFDANHTSDTAPLCGGCLTPVALVLNEVGVVGTTSSYKIIAPKDNNTIYWQAADPILGGATPARNTTWGEVKSLYR